MIGLNFCGECGRGIPDGESMWTVEVKEEIQHGGVIDVIVADAYLTYCRDCQGRFDFTGVSVPRI